MHHHRLTPHPQPRCWWPRKYRKRELVDKNVAATINELSMARKPWPALFCGKPGTGKTCAALCMLDIFNGLYSDFYEWCARICGARFGRLEQDRQKVFESTIWDQWKQTDLAVLDDIAIGFRASQSDMRILKVSLDLREGRPLVVISNAHWGRLLKMYDSPVMSRLEAGTRVPFKGDRRNPKKKMGRWTCFEVVGCVSLVQT